MCYESTIFYYKISMETTYTLCHIYRFPKYGLGQALKMRVGRVLFFGLNAVILTSRNSIRASGGYTVSHIVIP
jgi:hypothetical protein